MNDSTHRKREFTGSSFYWAGTADLTPSTLAIWRNCRSDPIEIDVSTTNSPS